MTNKNKRRFVISAAIAKIVHIFGIIMIFLCVYGMTTRKLALVAPIILKYSLASQPVYYELHSLLFLYKSWYKGMTQNILRFIEESNTPYKRPIKYKIYTMVSLCLAIGGIVTRCVKYAVMVYKDPFRKIQIYHYIEDNNVIDFLLIG